MRSFDAYGLLRVFAFLAQLLFVAGALPRAQAQTSKAEITIPAQGSTSAGVFDSQGRLVRTLWSARRLSAGPLVVTWDGREDTGRIADPAEHYVAGVLVHNVRYIWQGVIGNTSREASGTNVHRALLHIESMAFDHAGNAFYAVGYNEAQSSLHRFRVSDPQRAFALAHGDYRRVFPYVATDGRRAYFANIGHVVKPGNPRDGTFVVALQVSDGAEYQFTHGQAEGRQLSPSSRWESVIDYSPGDFGASGFSRAAPSGIAVQQHGNELLVAHAALNEIHVIDKTSGERIDTIAVRSPRGLAIAPDDSFWALCDVAGISGAVHYRQTGAGWEPAEQITEDLERPVAIAVSPVDGTVLIADAGTEQLKAFDAYGQRTWTLGERGGYADHIPEVTPQRLWLSMGPTYVAFQSDGSFWVGDPGNDRNLHFSRNLRYLDQIMFLPERYLCAVDIEAPTRVFSGFLEFKVDYHRSLRKSWALVRNWAAGIGAEYLEPGVDGINPFAGIRFVVTVAGRRTFALVPRRLPPASDVFEMTSTGLRFAGRLSLGDRLYPDGSQRGQVLRGESLLIYQRKLVGLDATGLLTWEQPQELARVGHLDQRDPYYHDVPIVMGANDPAFPQTANGLVVSFTPGMSTGFHLGALRPGVDGWIWRASPTESWSVDTAGNVISPDGSYEVGRGVRYPAGIPTVAGPHIVYPYHGEGWNGGEANQWLHFLDNGLFVGQFGRPDYPRNNELDALPEVAGNAFSPQLVSAGGHLYLWHNDENVHSGVHRWRIDGADTLRVLRATLAP